jgi:uncharacterized protein (TIGR02594 family)
MEPEWLTYARTLIGVREIKGPKHSATIMGWIKALGAGKLGITVRDDETAWCGTFVAHVLDKHGIPLRERVNPTRNIIAVRAKAWLGWGRMLLAERLGCIMVYDRKGGGHVGFYVGEDATHHHILGGNQGNAVSIMRLEKSRCIGMRWPFGVDLPEAKPVLLTPTGAPVSDNEA